MISIFLSPALVTLSYHSEKSHLSSRITFDITLAPGLVLIVGQVE
jgi:hypothetical protein